MTPFIWTQKQKPVPKCDMDYLFELIYTAINLYYNLRVMVYDVTFGGFLDSHTT